MEITLLRPHLLTWTKHTDIEGLTHVCRVSKEQKELDLGLDGELNHLVGDMGSMAIENEENLLSAFVPSLSLGNEALLEPLGAECVTGPTILGRCDTKVG